MPDAVARAPDRLGDDAEGPGGREQRRSAWTARGAFGASAGAAVGPARRARTALPQGDALVGAFGTASRLFIREPITARISEATDDDYLRNRARVLVELRAGLAIWDAKGFCRVNLKA